ncbi:hypothetical protein Tsubulata_030983 [Turnera subulata]|nr:hypothetical protein Tsubulata_030983 [Turnera subulata]
MNYLSPSVKHGDFSEQEDDLIIRLHKLLGNRWSLIAGRVPGRTDNQVKNHWNTHLSKTLGVNNAKRKATAAPSSSSLRGLEVNSNIIPSTTNYAPAPGFDVEASGQNTKRSDCKNVEQCSTTQGLCTSSNCHKEPFWFTFDETNVCSPNLMELLGNESLDVLWHGL